MSAADFENVKNQLTFENESNQCNHLDFISKDFPNHFIALRDVKPLESKIMIHAQKKLDVKAN